MIKADLESIKECLKNNNFDVQVQEETNQLYILFKLFQVDFPLFIKVSHEGELIQLLMFIPSQLNTQKSGDVARLLHFLNKEMDVPGFGLDENNKVFFYRFVIATSNKEIEESTVVSTVNAARVACETFATTIQAVNQGKLRFEEVLSKSVPKQQHIKP